ncbi:MAG TPA: multicopper oxidase family protein [Candidatus Methanoperedens sp.]
MKLRRRDFVKYSIAAAGFLATGKKAFGQMMGGMMGGGMGGGGTTIIDPPPGMAFTDPVVIPNLSSTPGIVEVKLEAKASPVNVNGTDASLLTYNGHYPAPTIKARKGDILKIHFKNSLPMMGTNILGQQRDMTNLHTHGLHVSPSGNSDNSMLMFMSGDTFDYEFDLSNQYPSTLNIYHPHVHETVAEQDWGGMAGAIVIEDDIDVLKKYETHLLILKDINLSGTEPEPYTSIMEYMHGKEGNMVMVNGLVNPVLKISPGQVQRWRILNASNARFYKLSLENHTMYVVGTEGGLLNKPYPVSYILLSPGERVEVLVKANQTVKNYKFLSLPYNRGCGGMGQQVTLMTLSYKGSRVNDAIPSVINPAAARLNVTPAKTERLVLSMGRARGHINGITFTMENHFSIHSHVGTYEVWEIMNESGMDHPFHQHVNACQVLSITGGDPSYASLYTKAPAWKDVVIVPKWGSVKILVPVMDYDGMAMFHCHILEHEDIGMMGIWDIM